MKYLPLCRVSNFIRTPKWVTDPSFRFKKLGIGFLYSTGMKIGKTTIFADSFFRRFVEDIKVSYFNPRSPPISS